MSWPWRCGSSQQFAGIANGEQEGFERDGAVLFRNRYLLSRAITPEHFTVPGLTRAMQDAVAQQGGTLGLLGHGAAGTRSDRRNAEHPRSARHLQPSPQLWPESGSRKMGHARYSWHERSRPARTRMDRFKPLRSFAAHFHSWARALRYRHGCDHGLERAARLRRRGAPHNPARSWSAVGVEYPADRHSIAIRLSLRDQVLILGFLPVICGALAGLTAVALTFNVVYGITLGFGITLIGEAVDYSVYLFIQAERRDPRSEARPANEWTTSLWPIIRLGMLTSVCGFASLLPSAFPSLAQLGLFTIAGLIAAALVTRFVLPSLLPKAPFVQTLDLPTRILTKVIAVLRRGRLVLWPLALLAFVALYLNRAQLWNRELSALSPVSLADQRRDASLRADLGAADVSDLVVVSGSGL